MRATCRLLGAQTGPSGDARMFVRVFKFGAILGIQGLKWADSQPKEAFQMSKGFTVLLLPSRRSVLSEKHEERK
jgi:hypothetical protein